MTHTEDLAWQKMECKGVRLIHVEENEVHPRGGHAYEKLFFMEREGQLAYYSLSSSFYVQTNKPFDPLEWSMLAGSDYGWDKMLHSAGLLLRRGGFSEKAAQLLDKITDQPWKQSAEVRAELW